MAEMTNFLMLLIFLIGYVFITIEHTTKINKATVALLMGAFIWIVQFKNPDFSLKDNIRQLSEQVSSVSQIVIFLLGALTIVETINSHRGFEIISKAIKIHSKRKLLWVSGFITFFLSSVLDNLTSTIVMVTLLSKMVDEKYDRWILGAGVVIAANAGGAWTPIGDVTTTMLWIGGQVTTLSIMRNLFLPSIACMIASFAWLHFMIEGSVVYSDEIMEKRAGEPMSNIVFILGIASLIFVPILKITTGIPPFLGILLGLGVLWLFTDFVHKKFDDRDHLKMPHVLTKIDLSSVLFFLGILLAVDGLDTAGILQKIAGFLDSYFKSSYIIAILIGFISSILDNVPLVAAVMSMYSLERFPMDSSFWQLTAYAAGTGGSMLIIGSAAGVVFMGLEKVDFMWYFKKISLAALIGYLAGIAVYFLT